MNILQVVHKGVQDPRGRAGGQDLLVVLGRRHPDGGGAARAHRARGGLGPGEEGRLLLSR